MPAQPVHGSVDGLSSGRWQFESAPDDGGPVRASENHRYFVRVISFHLFELADKDRGDLRFYIHPGQISEHVSSDRKHLPPYAVRDLGPKCSLFLFKRLLPSLAHAFYLPPHLVR